MNKGLFMKTMSNIGNVLMNNIQMGLSYEGWRDEFSYGKIKQSFSHIKEQMKELIGDITTLNADELQEIGFVKYKEGDIFLIPLWAYDLIPDGTELTNIMGGKSIKGEGYIDLEVRFGCIPYGLIAKEGDTP